MFLPFTFTLRVVACLNPRLLIPFLSSIPTLKKSESFLNYNNLVGASGDFIFEK